MSRKAQNALILLTIKENGTAKWCTKQFILQALLISYSNQIITKSIAFQNVLCNKTTIHLCTLSSHRNAFVWSSTLLSNLLLIIIIIIICARSKLILVYPETMTLSFEVVLVVVTLLVTETDGVMVVGYQVVHSYQPLWAVCLKLMRWILCL